MTRNEAAPLPGDLLLRAVEAMERPLFVLGEDWRFRPEILPPLVSPA